MARRGQDSSDKLHNRRKQALKDKDFKAKQKSKVKVPDIIISCEDSVWNDPHLVDGLIDDRHLMVS